MTKKTLAWFGAALLAGALALGCGGSKKEAAEPTAPAETGTMGGAAYGAPEGGAAYGAPEGGAPAPEGGAPANPCGGAANPCGG